MPSRIHFGPTGDDLDRSGDKQRGHNDHGEYVTHGKPLFPHRVGIVSITSKRCDRRHKGPLFCGHPSAKGQPLCLALRLKVSAVLVVKSTNGLLDFVPITCAVTLQNYSKEDTMGDRERLPIGFFRDMISLPIVTEVMLYGHVRLIEGIVLPPTFVGCYAVVAFTDLFLIASEKLSRERTLQRERRCYFDEYTITVLSMA
jgi:hypothetical protein